MIQGIRQDAEMASKIIDDAGGVIVGRTKIQKIAYMLEVMGLGDGFPFAYKRFGPFSDEFGAALKSAEVFDLISEEEKPTPWGGFYSVFRSNNQNPQPSSDARAPVVGLGRDADPVELELAATAAFLALEGYEHPWKETARRKPAKATEARVRRAGELYKQFQALDFRRNLPPIS